MTDATRIRAMELRLQADRVEEHAEKFAALMKLAEADPDLTPDARDALVLMAALTTPGESLEERAARRAVELARSDREARAVTRRAYVEHLASPDCDCGHTTGRWQFCDRAREEGFR